MRCKRTHFFLAKMLIIYDIYYVCKFRNLSVVVNYLIIYSLNQGKLSSKFLNQFFISIWFCIEVKTIYIFDSDLFCIPERLMFQTSFWIQHYLMNLCFRVVNSQRLFVVKSWCYMFVLKLPCKQQNKFYHKNWRWFLPEYKRFFWFFLNMKNNVR